ncbi:ribosomal protein L6, alpha-beta domain-containing protein [Podospora australis]|uniref:Ribosomal protein L6, alpha-beta domain-containing protein n=1 Tax=Podospora australis TaxID=1536484 RepID=A0AAN6WZ37_9PEZI|nr:ribosomal protein L6, alpha-beta domain-containing protein [Podospora australis]
MFGSSTSRRALACCNSSTSAATLLPSFLVPAFQTTTSTSSPSISSRRNFSATTNRPSKLGRNPLAIPPGVELEIGDLFTKKDVTTYLQTQKRKVKVSGPLGKLELDIPSFVKIDHDTTARIATLTVEDKNVKQQMEMWGTTWSYLNNYIMGVSEGHTAVLRLVGIGYRATIEPRPALEEYPGQQFVCLKLGFSHPVEMGLPGGMKASAPQPTRVLLEGVDKEQIMSFAANIRKWRVPEPYKGKGIFINDETIKLKQKKIK